jgi:hypothetical protein
MRRTRREQHSTRDHLRAVDVDATTHVDDHATSVAWGSLHGGDGGLRHGAG